MLLPSALFVIFVFFVSLYITLIHSLFLRTFFLPGSDIFRSSFGPRSNAANQNPGWRGFGMALQWSAAWSSVVVVVCAADSGQGAIFGQKTKKFIQGLEIRRILSLGPRFFYNRIFSARSIWYF